MKQKDLKIEAIMVNIEKKQKLSMPVSLLLLIPSLLLVLVSLAMDFVGLGLIPIFPAVIGILLSVISYFLFRRSYRIFTTAIISMALFAVVVSVFRGTIIKKKIAVDITFDSTVVKTQEGIESDLNDAFGGDLFGTEEKK